MKLQVRLPMEPGSIITDAAAASIKGQWLTVLSFGAPALGVVTDSAAMDDGRVLWLEVDAEEYPGLRIVDLGMDTTPVEPPETELKLDWSAAKGTHINCEHDPNGINFENAMVCDGPLS